MCQRIQSLQDRKTSCSGRIIPLLVACAVLAMAVLPPSASSTPIYDYVYTGTDFTSHYYTWDPATDVSAQFPADHLSIRISSPVPLSFSGSNQMATPGLTMTMFTGGSSLQAREGDLLYFYSSSDGRIPDSWLVQIFTIGIVMSSTNSVENINDGCLFGVRTAAISMNSSLPGSWALTVCDGGNAPVPEPMSLFLLGTGLVWIGLVRRKLSGR